MLEDFEELFTKFRYAVVDYESGTPCYASNDYWQCVDYIESYFSGNDGDEEPLFWIMDTNDFNGE